MDKRYQVFVSSTYADLKEERQRVIQALMEMDCIPAGMELFPAQDEEQWAFIKRVIDDCDYYLIIIGGRYGSMTSDGVSYTEKEFDYAVERGLKVVALLHEDPNSISVSKSDIDPAIREKLALFRTKVATKRLVKFWNYPEELPGIVALSLAKTIKSYPAVGWVRGSSVASEEILLEINGLRKTNNELKATLSKLDVVNVSQFDDIADFDSMFSISGEHKEQVAGRYYPQKWLVTLPWRRIFSSVAPYLMQRPNEISVKGTMIDVFTELAGADGISRTMDDQQFKTIGLQLKALGLVSIDYLQTTQGGWALFWSLTQKGESVMMNERVVRKPKE